MDRHTFGVMQEELRRRVLREVVYAPWTVADEAEMLAVWATGKGVLVPSGDPVGEVTARVNHSRWLADCPDCSGAMLLRQGQTRFVCGNCLNVAVDAPRRVVWPDDDPTGPLSVRPVPEVRNWGPPEQVADLVAENRERGWPDGLD
jgi:ribosomal protein S27AE